MIPRIAFEGHFAGDTALRRVILEEMSAELQLPDWTRAIPVRLTGEAVRRASVLELREVRLAMDEIRVLGSGTLGIGERQDLEVDLEIEPSNLRALLERSGAAPDTTDPAAFSRLAGRLGLRGRRDDVRVDPLVLELDGLTVAGTAGLRAGERIRIRFDLDAGRADLRPFLPASAATEEARGAGPLVNEAPLGLDALATVDLDGALGASALLLPGLEIGEARAELRADRGRVDLALDARELLGGRLDARLDLDLTQDRPELSLRLGAEDLDGGRLAPEAGFTGPVSVDGRLDAAGASSAALARDLRGRLDLSGTGGTLDVTGLRATLLPLAQLLGRGERLAAWPDELRYEALDGAWIIADGTGDQRLDLGLDNMTLDARGGIDLASGAFDFRAGVRFTDRRPRTFDVPGDLLGVRLPARCAGRLEEAGNPCGLDQQATGDLVRQIAAGRAGEALRERISEQVPEELRGTADALLRGLLGQPPAQPPPEEADP